MSMADRDGVIWYDGELVQWRDATTHVLTHTLHYGMGVFEGVRAYDTPQGTAIFRLQAHTDRLFDSAHIMNMQIPYSRDEINEATRAAVRENNLESAYIRPMVFYGSEGMGLRASGLKVHVIIAAAGLSVTFKQDSRFGRGNIHIKGAVDGHPDLHTSVLNMQAVDNHFAVKHEQSPLLGIYRGR